MGLPSRIVGVKGDDCDCGRRATVLHCVHCGSSRVYARQDRMHTLPNGEKRFVDVQYRCQTCGHLFIKEDREFCDAPPITPALARLKAQRLFEASKTNEYLSPEVIAKAQELAASQSGRSNKFTEELSKDIKAIAESEAEPIVVERDSSIQPDMQETADEVTEILQTTERQPNSAAMRAFLEEWSQFRYARGKNSIPKFEDFARRRLNGETVEVIMGE